MPKIAHIHGFQRHIIPFPMVVGAFTGTGAKVIMDSFTPGFRFVVEKVQYVVGPTAGAGAGGTQDIVVRKGGTSGTALATVTVPLASATAGAVIASNAAVASHSFSLDTDTISITRTTGGTAYTTEPLGMLLVVIREAPQARNS